MATATGLYMSELFDTTRPAGIIVKGRSAETDNHLKVSFNPSNHGLSISYKVSGSGMVTMKIFDIRGREIATLVRREMQPGSYVMQWNAARLPGGAYYCSLKSGGFSETKKLAMIK